MFTLLKSSDLKELHRATVYIFMELLDITRRDNITASKLNEIINVRGL